MVLIVFLNLLITQLRAVYNEILVPIETKTGFIESVVFLNAAPQILPLFPLSKQKSPYFFIFSLHIVLTVFLSKPSI